MGDSQLFEELIWKFALDIIFALGVLPAAGGAVLWKTFQLARIPDFTYWQCWKAYLAGCAYALVLFNAINIALGRPGGMEVIQLVIVIATPFVVVPLILRNFSRRVLAVEAAALVLIDLAILLLVLLSQLH